MATAQKAVIPTVALVEPPYGRGFGVAVTLWAMWRAGASREGQPGVLHMLDPTTPVTEFVGRLFPEQPKVRPELVHRAYKFALEQAREFEAGCPFTAHVLADLEHRDVKYRERKEGAPGEVAVVVNVNRPQLIEALHKRGALMVYLGATDKERAAQFVDDFASAKGWSEEDVLAYADRAGPDGAAGYVCQPPAGRDFDMCFPAEPSAANLAVAAGIIARLGA